MGLSAERLRGESAPYEVSDKIVRNVIALGQVFTPEDVVQKMLALRRNFGTVLEPSAGDGSFLRQIEKAVGVEIDPILAERYGALSADFFAYPTQNKFDTIIGNPPYVRYQDILPETKALLPGGFDKRTNLYLFFIRKALKHLNIGGELIFITPRDFLKATSAAALNAELHETGSITDYIELGDMPVFDGYSPNCAIWRWEAGRENRQMSCGNNFCYLNGQIWFGRQTEARLGDTFAVKVGAVSGADYIYANRRQGCTDFVYSKTAQNGKTRRMIYNRYDPALDPHKSELIQRRIRRFNETNWWQWGRVYYDTDHPRLYVNCKTRNHSPFFMSETTAYDGSVLALFPKKAINLTKAAVTLNEADWQSLGFVCDGRLQFTQKSLENAPMDIR